MPEPHGRNDPCEQLELPARLENLPHFIDFGCRQARELGFPPARINEIELVLEEALVNIIEYAYTTTDGRLIIESRPDGDNGLVFVLRDTGPSFNPLAASDPGFETGLEDRPIGGLGIHFIKKLADTVAWRRQNRENQLTIVFKKCHAAPN